MERAPCADTGAHEFQDGGKPAEIVLGDVDGDGAVGSVDLAALLAAWGPAGEGCELADLDLDGAIGIDDLLVVLANWG